MKAIKHSVSYVIYNNNRSKFLAVKRPPDDEDLPNVWGLPAGSLKEDETAEESIVRSGKEKLGVRLKVSKLLRTGKVERQDYTLFMKLYKAEILNGKPKVPQAVKGVTQYQAWKWATPKDLKEAAKKGSLCSQLYLASINQKW